MLTAGLLALEACTGLFVTEPTAPPLAVDHGVDVPARRIRVGALNDESGAAKAIGHPFAVGKRVLAARIAAGDADWLPAGWTIELVERDHGYDPSQARQSLSEIQDDVLFVATSFGTDHTLALQDALTEADLVAFPASLSTALHGHPLTPPLGASYRAEGQRAVDFVVDQADGGPMTLAVVHRDDAYGRDVVSGVQQGAAAYGLEAPLVLAATDLATLGDRLNAASVTHVVLGTLPPTTQGLLEDALRRSSTVTWVGTTPAWSDALASHPQASELLARYRQTSSLPFWGEEVPGMTAFEEAFAAHAPGEPSDGYVLVSYVQGLVQLEAVRTAIEAGDVTRAGFRRALQSLRSVDAHGMLSPLDLSRLPGPVTERVRILVPRPGASGPRFDEVLPSMRPGPRRGRPGQAAMDDEANVGSNPGEVTGELEGEEP